MPRLVVFSGDLSFAVRKGIVELDRRIPGAEWLIVEHAPKKTIRQIVRNQLGNLERNGWRWVVYQAREVAGNVFRSSVSNAGPSTASAPGHEYALEALLARSNVRLYRTPDINGGSAITVARDFAPDLGIALASPILKEALFGTPRLGTINLHKGKVPDYRGMPPAFWEVWNGETSVGCTVHRVNAGLDKGEIVAETSVRRQRYSTVKGLQLTLDEVGIALTCDAVASVLDRSAAFRAQAPGGRSRTKPTLRQVAQLERRLQQELPQRPGLLRRILKTLVLASCLYILRPLRMAFSGTPTVTVILYHRVSDELRDSLTVGIEQFERQMRMIREHCHPLSIEEVLRGEFPRRPAKPLVCVTFDDGYKDNFTTAVPALQRHQIPAAFFVSTGLIGTARQFDHDQRKHLAPQQNMSWDDLRQMRKDGFVIGSHSVNHIDIAAEPPEIVERELRVSLDSLRSELGTNEVILAYPFGGRENMTAQRLEMVKQAGYTGCLSAYGGFNRGAVDRWNVLRCGVHWEFSDLAFRCRSAGIR